MKRSRLQCRTENLLGWFNSFVKIPKDRQDSQDETNRPHYDYIGGAEAST